MIRKIKLLILNFVEIFHIVKILPVKDVFSFFFTFYLWNGQELVSLSIKPLNGRKVYIRRGSIIDRDVIKYVFYNQFHLPLIPLCSRAVILDLGSNIGLTLLHFKQLHPDSWVLGYELDHNNFNIAVSNINGVIGCNVYNLAVWKKSGSVKYRADDFEDAFNIIDNPTNLKENIAIKEAKATTITQIIERHSLTKIDYLKIDIEGAEKNIFSETSCEWLNLVQQLNIEIHDSKFCEELIKILESRGFFCRKDSFHRSLVRAARKVSNQPIPF